jgi:hypothetical protein
LPVPTPRSCQADDPAGAQRLHRSRGVQAATHGRSPGMGKHRVQWSEITSTGDGTVTASGAIFTLADGAETECTRFRAEFMVVDGLVTAARPIRRPSCRRTPSRPGREAIMLGLISRRTCAQPSGTSVARSTCSATSAVFEQLAHSAWSGTPEGGGHQLSTALTARGTSRVEHSRGDHPTPDVGTAQRHC